MVRSSLDTYRRKRDFGKTSEPPGKLEKGPGGRFVVHEHHASRLHFDLRLEMGGVLKSYAVPKGPSLDPKDRRLAVETEDHPVKYLNFQGSISDGQYGAGQMVIWDRGTYSVPPGEDPLEQYAQGKLHLQFTGEKLKGGFMLIRSHRGDRQWLFFKKRDEAASEESQPGLILPYGARTEKPEGFEIPQEALRDLGPGSGSRGGGNKGAGAKGSASKGSASTGGESKKAGSKAVSKGSARKGGTKAKHPAGSKPAAMPAFFQPMLAKLTDKPFDDAAWVFESKWDGWRALLRKEGDEVHLVSRNGKPLDAMFPELVEAGKGLRAQACMLDGEVVALDEQGVPRFQMLQGRLKAKGGKFGKAIAGAARGIPGRLVYYAFDLPYWEGLDLTACTLLDRKAVLSEIISGTGDPSLGTTIIFSEHFQTRGREVFQNAVQLGLEGVIAKLQAGPYIKGRSADWLKIKTKLRQEVVIAGYTEPRGTRSLFGSIVV
ncbi:MAG: DNA polymerase ligase N-terminal domain-containing protein, partial [Fibrobacteria bacterium]